MAKRASGSRKGTINSKTPSSSSRANVAGPSKRPSKTFSRSVEDVYDYQPEKSKRANIKLTLDEDEAMGYGHDDEDSDSFEAQMRNRPRLVGLGDDDELATDEDEEIDSDEAFGTSDEERYADFDFRKYKKSNSKVRGKKAAKRAVAVSEINLNEEDYASPSVGSGEGEEEEEEEGDDDEYIDVLDVLDGRGVPKYEDNDNEAHAITEDGLGNKQPQIKAMHQKSGRAVIESDEDRISDDDASESEDDESGDESEEHDDIAISGSDEDADVSALDALGNFVTNLETGAKRKTLSEVAEEASQPQAKKKKRALNDRTEAGVENEFGAKVASSSKLSLDDLLVPLSSQPDVTSSLKKSLKPLVSTSKVKAHTLSAPLPTRTQEKLDREAAYEQTKEEVEKWSETMKKIREAEHLSFPLQAPRSVKVSNLELTAKFKPETELESSIDRLLKSAKLREEDINKTEDLMMKELSIEEVAQRRAELRKMRELAFRADAKAKRVAKIKSKAYHRIQKKERAKLQAKIDAGNTGNEEEDRLKAEIDRARERATLKHKNTGKWAKAMRDRNELDEDQRRDLNEMLDRGEKLRRRIQGVGSGSDGDTSDGNDSDGEAGIERIKASAFEELAQLQSEHDVDDLPDSMGKKGAKSVFELKFMKDAAAKRRGEVDRMIDDFREELGHVQEEDKGEEEESGHPSHGERINGRMVFKPGPQVQLFPNGLPPPPPSAISEASTLKSHDSSAAVPTSTVEISPHSPVIQSPSTAAELITEPNPWLVPSTSNFTNKIAKRRNEVLVGKNSSRSQKATDALQKQMQKTEGEKERQKDDAIVEIALENTLSESLNQKSEKLTPSNDPSSKKKKKKSKKKGGDTIQPNRDEDSDVNSEVEEQEAALRKGPKVKAFEQRELVRRAFAGDNVVQQFSEDKRKEIEEDAPREVDTTLPGWGSWGGAGTKKAPAKPHLIKKVAGIDPKSRADYGKANVIISERRDKKAEKYAVRDLPYPYTSKAQFDSLMSTPLGVEWNTRLSFQRGTLPRVVKKMGTVIEPLEKL